MLEWLKNLHSAAGISELIAWGGQFVVTGIVFAETGLLMGFFLPGDSLLITAGVLSNPANPYFAASLGGIVQLNIMLAVAAVVGGQTGYFLGRRVGDRIWQKPDGRFYKKKHLESAQAFYLRYGGLAVVGAHYVPILRTFVPFAAGLARMPYRKFALWDGGGGILWITSLVWIGYYLGQTELANRLDKLIVIVVFVSLIPLMIGALKKALASRRLPPGSAARESFGNR